MYQKGNGTAASDIEVTGVIDPPALELTPQQTAPMPLDKAGIWIDKNRELMYQKGNGTAASDIKVAAAPSVICDLTAISYINSWVDIGLQTIAIPAGNYYVEFGAVGNVGNSSSEFANMMLKITDTDNTEHACVESGISKSGPCNYKGQLTSISKIVVQKPVNIKLIGTIGAHNGQVTFSNGYIKIWPR
jgi:hypothetical protein